MKRLMATLFCVSLVASFASLAQDKKAPTEKQQAQQERMKACNQKAGDRKLGGDARKSYMSACLKGEEPASDKQKVQQNRMKDCNKQAADKKMKGDERKGFISTCLKG